MFGKRGNTDKVKKKRVKLHEVTPENDIRYRGPLSCFHFQILGWLCIVLSQAALIVRLAGHIDADAAVNTAGALGFLQNAANLSLPFLLIFVFAQLLDTERGCMHQLVRNAAAMAGIWALSCLVFYRYIVGGIGAFIENPGEVLPAVQTIIAQAAPSGFVAFNIFVDLFLCALSMFFLNYKPRHIFTGKSRFIFRLLGLLPLRVHYALGRFVEGAFMPAMLNLVWIAALGLLCFFPGLAISTRVAVVCWAILLGGLAQMLFLMRCMAKRGYAFRFALPDFSNPRFRLVWKNTFIGAVGAGAIQINYMLDQVLAQCAAPWAAGVIGYAERLMDLPLGVVGVAFGTVLLPTFSGFFAREDHAGARRALGVSVLQMLAVMVPASVVTFFCAPWIVELIYEGHAFDATATVRVARALSVYGLGLSFFAIQKCMIPFFQAQKDMKTPLNVTLATIVLNAALNVAAVVCLPQEWRHVGLAASTSFCSFAGCLLFALAFIRQIRYNTRH